VASRFIFQALLEVSNWKYLAASWNENYLRYPVDPISKYLKYNYKIITQYKEE
jgi:hypothetical protein